MAPPEGLAKKLQEYGVEFDKLCQDMHSVQDDPEAWLTGDTIDQTLKGLAYLANLATYSYIRIRLLQDRMKDEVMPENVDFTKEF